jgi:hypothetical protein
MKRIILLFALIFTQFLIVQAQTTVTFNVDLRPMMKDSTFIPGQDFLQVNGNLYPFGLNRPVRMSDNTPKDSIFTAEVQFSRRFNNERLKYYFEIVKPDETLSESSNRFVHLNGQDIILPPVGFNSYVY